MWMKRVTKRAALKNAKRIGFNPGTIIDVGFAYGTEGLFDLFPDARKILIEPVAEMEPVMQQFCRDNPGSSYVLAAASDTAGRQKMVVRQGVTGSGFHTKFQKENSERRKVATITLDQLVGELAPPKPYLIKLDVEGHEMHVLDGAKACLPDTEMVLMEIGTWADDHVRGRPSMMDLFRRMEEERFVFYDFLEPAYREVDGALYMFDAIFVKADSVLRAQRRHRDPEQAAKAREDKVEHAREALDQVLKKAD